MEWRSEYIDDITIMIKPHYYRGFLYVRTLLFLLFHNVCGIPVQQKLNNNDAIERKPHQVGEEHEVVAGLLDCCKYPSYGTTKQHDG